MAEGTLIEWARHPVTGLGATWNITTGCDLVSPGCTNCYAMKLAGTRLRNHESRQGLTIPSKAGPVWNGEVRYNEFWLTLPLTWKKPRGIFVSAHGDLFAEGITDDQLDRIFAVMALCPQHVFYVLTKRPERMRDYIAAIVDTYHASPNSMDKRFGEICVDLTNSPCASGAFEDRGWPLRNVWLGVSVEDQKRADERIPVLLDTPAAIRFISAEPLLGAIRIVDAMWAGDTPPTENLHASLDWVIAGGESGPNARPSHPDWFRDLRDQCAEAGTAFFFKQWGVWHEAATELRELDGSHLQVDADSYEGEEIFDAAIDRLIAADGRTFTPATLPPDTLARLIERIGKKAAGRQLDGRTHDEFPEVRP